MERGNKPVPYNFEMREAHLSELPKDNSQIMALVPFSAEMSDEDRQLNKDLPVAAATKTKQMVYGDLDLGSFEDEISGINLSKLFSVYGPQSAEGKRKKKQRQLAKGMDKTRSDQASSIQSTYKYKVAFNPHIIPMQYSDQPYESKDLALAGPISIKGNGSKHEQTAT